MKRIQLLIIDEHSAVRNALKTRLASSPSLEVLATAHSINDLDVGTLHPKVVLWGLKSSHNREFGSLVRMVASLVKNGTAVIVLVSYADEVERELLLQAGAWGYLLKDINTPELIHQIEEAALGGLPAAHSY